MGCCEIFEVGDEIVSKLKQYYDAVTTAEARVKEIAARIDGHFEKGEKAEAMKLKPELDEATKNAKEANELYMTMRSVNDAENGKGPQLLRVKDDDLKIGMSAKELENYSLLRALNALVEHDWSKAGLEAEASKATAEKLGKNPQGFFVPWDVQMAPMRKRAANVFRPLNTQQVGDPTKGGYLVETQLLSESFIDVLRNRIILGQAGATLLTGLVGDIDIPKKTATSTMYWIGEGNAPSKSTLTFGQIAARPRTGAAYLQLTRRFLKQSSLDAEMMARDDMASAIAVGMDYAALHGLGAANQPRGLQYLTGIGSVVGGNDGAAPDWGDIVDLETAVAIDNADIGRLGYLTNTKVRGKLKKTEKASSTAIFIWSDGNELNGYPGHVSNQVRSDLVKGNSGAVCSAIFYGNFADAVMCFWGGLDVIVDPYTNSTSGDVLITAMQDADIVFRRAESFAAMLDALTS